MDAIAAITAPHPARRTLVSGSVSPRKSAATAIETNARPRNPARMPRAAIDAADTSTATLNPLIASTWLMPAIRKSAAGSSSPCNRTPVVIATASATVGAGVPVGIDSTSTPLATDRSDRTTPEPGSASIRVISRDDSTSSVARLRDGPEPGNGFDSNTFIQPRMRMRAPRPGMASSPATRTETSSVHRSRSSPRQAVSAASVND